MSEERFNFTEWMELAKRDPEACAKKRQDMLYKWIDDKYPLDDPRNKRLKGVLWVTWQQTYKVKNPLVRLDRAAQAMWNAFYKMKDTIGDLNGRDT